MGKGRAARTGRRGIVATPQRRRQPPADTTTNFDGRRGSGNNPPVPTLHPLADDTQLVLVTCPATHAEMLARTLVERRLAACVNILPGVTSVYRWQSAVQTAQETQLLIKTTAARYAALEEAVRELHPYELPEVIAVDIAMGLPAYLNWLRDSTL